MKIRIKMCGMMRSEDALFAAEIGVDAIGFIFYEKSPRYISPEKAKEIIKNLPPFVTTVGVFMNNPEKVKEVLNSVPLDVLQFHGNETPEECCQFKKPYIKSVNMLSSPDLFQICDLYHEAQGILLDTIKPEIGGGTGEAFDWRQIPAHLPKPIILAGGLNSQNVGVAIEMVQPYAVDVASGVEISKGIKDHQKIQAFAKIVSQF